MGDVVCLETADFRQSLDHSLDASRVDQDFKGIEFGLI
jgi:hypothetical protein